MNETLEEIILAQLPLILSDGRFVMKRPDVAERIARAVRAHYDVREIDLREPHARVMNNRHLLLQGGTCGCFYCLKTFDAAAVTTWVDHDATALCPHCGIDAVLSGRVDRTDSVFLQLMHDRWFGRTVPVAIG